MTTAYPLRWPEHVQRRPLNRVKPASFGKSVDGAKRTLSVADALGRLQSEADLLGARYPVISSNVELRLDGKPRSGQREPDDPAVAFWFQLNGKPVCLPCDTFNRVADNIAAIAAHIGATRKIERYGVASVSQMFTGFEALPAPRGDHWSDILEISRTATVDQINAAYRQKAKQAHSDAGGSDAAMSRLNVARDAALRERGS